MSLSGRIKRRLEEESRSASWLAGKVNVSPSTMTRWLSMENPPIPVDMALQIAEALEIHPSVLLGCPGNRNPGGDMKDLTIPDIIRTLENYLKELKHMVGMGNNAEKTSEEP